MEPRRALLVAAWVMATSLMMFVTYRAVSLVGGAVTDQPTAATFLTTTTAPPSLVGSGSTPTTVPDPTDDSPPGSFVAPASTSSTVPPSTPTSTSTSLVAASSTTRGAPATGPHTIPSQGGSVTVLCYGDAISFSGAVPAAGYSPSIEDTGPERVEVEFESASTSWEVRIECSSGAPNHDIKQSD